MRKVLEFWQTTSHTCYNKSISSRWWCSCVCDSANIFYKHPSLVIYFFATPADKTETESVNRWGRSTNSKPPGQIIMIGQLETLIRSEVRSYLVHSFLQVHSSRQPPQTIFLIQTGIYFDFSSSNFNVQHCWSRSK